MKTSFSLLLIFISILTTGCPSDPGVKVYEHIPDEAALKLKGFYRNEGAEFLTYEQAKGYYAVSPSDMEFILNKIKQCGNKNLSKYDNGLIMAYLLGGR